MGQARAENPAHAAIRDATYPAAGDAACTLYDQLRYEQEHAGEAVDFTGGNPDSLGLDVGGYDGLYRPVIGQLGLSRVVTIEPGDELGRGIRAGFTPAGDAFHGTLQRWVAANHEPAQSVFVINMQSELPNRPGFMRSLVAATAVGGIVAVTFREPITAVQFTRAAQRGSPLNLGLRLLQDLQDLRKEAPQPDETRSRFLYLYRREEP